MDSYRLNVFALGAISVCSLLCTGYISYINTRANVELQDYNVLSLALINTVLSLMGLCLIISLENKYKNRNDIHSFSSNFDDLPLPSFNKRILTRSRSFDTLKP